MAVLAVLLAVVGLRHSISSIRLTSPPALLSLDVWGPLLLAIVLIPVFVAAERRAARSGAAPVDLGTTSGKAGRRAIGRAGLGEAGMVFMPQLAVAALGLGRSQASYILCPWCCHGVRFTDGGAIPG